MATSRADTPELRVERMRVLLARWLAGGGVALLVALALFGLAARDPGGVAAGAPAPAFDLPLLAGGRVGNADFAGRVVVVNVWASWCPPCREEAPTLTRVFADVDPTRVAFLGVAHDDTVSGVRGFLQRFGVPYPTALDDGSFGRAYGLQGLPTTYVIGADGTLLNREFGPVGEAQLRALIADALARSSAGGSAPGPLAQGTTP